jgi:hypothetical protein
VKTLWLFLLLVWVHLSDVLFPNRWAAFVSGLGLGTAVLVWMQRGRRFSIRWFICLWGAIEGLQIFVCHGAFNWFPIRSEKPLCEAYTGWPLYGWGIVCVAVLAYWMVTEKDNGRRN